MGCPGAAVTIRVAADCGPSSTALRFVPPSPLSVATMTLSMLARILAGKSELQVVDRANRRGIDKGHFGLNQFGHKEDIRIEVRQNKFLAILRNGDCRREKNPDRSIQRCQTWSSA